MLPEDIKTTISEWVPEATFDETGEWLNATIPSIEWKALAKKLRHTAGLDCDFLFCLTCIDWSQTPAGKTHLTMVYHLTSTIHRHNFVVRCNLDRDNPEIDTVSGIWRTAEFHEREVYELFGVRFLEHPDLRRLILTDDFEGWPLRKDFEDPINMIKL
jgi:NADH-quinone oxidoreductase subunit C